MTAKIKFAFPGLSASMCQAPAHYGMSEVPDKTGALEDSEILCFPNYLTISDSLFQALHAHGAHSRALFALSGVGHEAPQGVAWTNRFR